MKKIIYKISALVIILALAAFFTDVPRIFGANEFDIIKLDVDQLKKLAEKTARWSSENHLNSMSYHNNCAVFGILKVAGATGNNELRMLIEDTFRPELLEGVSPHRDNADNPAHRWFGFVPLELYKQTKNPLYLKTGIELAEHQYENADENGMPSYTARLFVDDIYGATAMQSLAYTCTGDEKYLERAVQQVLFYSRKFMQPNGLFFHNVEEAPYFWGRGNGWCAAAFGELLAVLPENHPKRDSVLYYYNRMVDALVKYQAKDGMWLQLVDDSESWAETSCTGMFIFSLAQGIRYGVLKPEIYVPIIEKAWQSLSTYVDDDYRVTEVCRGTSFGDREYYLNRPRVIGDPHGQAAFLWAAVSLFDLKKNGVTAIKKN